MVRFKVWFANNRGVSVSRSDTSYGGRDGLYELAVLGKTVNGYDLDYSTSVTDNVVGYLEWPDIEKLLLQVQALPPRNLQDPIK
jgi:hypothetical protein